MCDNYINSRPGWMESLIFLFVCFNFLNSIANYSVFRMEKKNRNSLESFTYELKQRLYLQSLYTKQNIFQSVSSEQENSSWRRVKDVVEK